MSYSKSQSLSRVVLSNQIIVRINLALALRMFTINLQISVRKKH